MQTSAFVSSVGGEMMGTLVRPIDGINFMGMYGIGLMIGGALNISITIWLGLKSQEK